MFCRGIATVQSVPEFKRVENETINGGPSNRPPQSPSHVLLQCNLPTAEQWECAHSYPRDERCKSAAGCWCARLPRSSQKHSAPHAESNCSSEAIACSVRDATFAPHFRLCLRHDVRMVPKFISRSVWCDRLRYAGARAPSRLGHDAH